MVKMAIKTAVVRIRDESGITMPLIIGVIAVAFILAAGLSMTVSQQQKAVARDQAAVKALHVAEAGANDYLWHLNEDHEYYLKSVHPAQGDGKWVSKNGGRYHLDVIPPTGDEPVVTVKATARFKNPLGDEVERAVIARYRKKSFVNYIYMTNHERTPNNQRIYWITGDVVNGPLMTNEDLFISGDPIFNDSVTIGGRLVVERGNPVFKKGYTENAKTLDFPATNDKLKLETQARGYYYYGQTTITLRSDGYLQISNSDTSGRTTGPVGIVPIPPNGVIYIDGNSYRKWTPSNGDVFISGTLKGKLTVGAADMIYITGDIQYSNDAEDMLGLVANDSILINHYDSSGRDVAPYNITIKGALFALNNSFGFERYSEGSPKGTISFKGSIVQNYRGPVGTFSSRTGEKLTGYSKNYSYDQRMLYKSPPHFIEPLNAGFELAGWSEVN